MKKIIGLFLTLSFCSFICGENLYAGKGFYPGSGLGGYATPYNREWAKVKEREGKIQLLEQLSARKKVLADAGDTSSDLYKQIVSLEKDILNELGSSKGSGKQYADIMARGIAGEDWDMLDGIKAEGPLDGIGNGLAVRTAREFGNAVGEKLKDSLKVGIGGVWDWIIDRTKYSYRFIFHASNKPFTKKEIIDGWLPLIRVTLEDLHAMLRDGLRDVSRSQTDMALRLTELDPKDGAKPDVEATQPADNFWVIFINGYIEQFDYLAQLMEERKNYYKEDDIIVFYADQIKRRLLELKDLLLKAKSLKDLDAILGSNKNLIIAEKRNIESLLTRLADCVDISGTPSKSLTAASSAYSGYYGKGDSLGLGGADDMYPGGFGAKGY